MFSNNLVKLFILYKSNLCIPENQRVLWDHKGLCLLVDQTPQTLLLSPLYLEIQEVLDSPMKSPERQYASFSIVSSDSLNSEM